MHITKYVPLSAAVQEVYRLFPEQTEVDYNELYELAYTGYEALMVRQVYEEAMWLVDVVNHTFQLPKGLVYIEQMFYKDETSDPVTTNVPIYNGDMAVTEITTSDFQFLLDQGTMWQPLRLSPSIWSNTFVCTSSPTIGCVSEHTYTLTKNRCVITSFQDGQVAIGGLRYPVAEDGELLIPDERDVREAIKYYVLMTYFMSRDILQLEGSAEREQRYRRYWEMYAAKCRGNMMLMSIDQLENFRTQMNRIGQHNETYNNAFSNLSTGENINLNG